MGFEPEAFLRSTLLLLMLLNPFLMSVYLLDLVQSLDSRAFASTLGRGACIATLAFFGFAIGGEAVFSRLLQIRFASFLVFGGILFLVVGIRFAQHGPQALSQLRGDPKHLAGSIAMPFMIGPGTVSASVLAGARLPLPWALASIVCAMVGSVAGLLAIKAAHDRLSARNAALIDRYIDLVGRASALLIGTIAIDMVLNGIELWWATWRG